MRGLAAELLHHIGRHAPVGVDQAAFDPQRVPVFPVPFPSQLALCEGLQPCPEQPKGA